MFLTDPTLGCIVVGPGRPRPGRADGGIHRDPDTDELYILVPEGEQR